MVCKNEDTLLTQTLGTRLLDEEYPDWKSQAKPTLFPSTEGGKECGQGVIGCLQQLSQSEHAGFPQQVTTVAAYPDSEMKRTGANANTSALSFIKIISF
jgi:hypothetical protein